MTTKSLMQAFKTASVAFKPETLAEVAQTLQVLQSLGYVWFDGDPSNGTFEDRKTAKQDGLRVDTQKGTIHICKEAPREYYATRALLDLSGEELLALNRHPVIKMMIALQARGDVSRAQIGHLADIFTQRQIDKPTAAVVSKQGLKPGK